MREYQKSYYEYYTEGNAVRKRVVEVPQQEPRQQEQIRVWKKAYRAML